jgi:hypothetical protein
VDAEIALSQIVTAELWDTGKVSRAFASAGPAGGGRCDAPACPAFAMRQVDILGQDFYFCSHHWSEHRRRLPVVPQAPPGTPGGIGGLGEGGPMRAAAGDRLVIRAHHAGELNRIARILEVRGPDGTPPYLVEWCDDGRVGLLFPGSDAVVEPRTAAVPAEHG